MRHRILIIDDELATTELLQKVLMQAGYRTVKSIVDPREAPVAFVKFQPDLVVLDLNMPGMDGFAVLDQLRPLRGRGTFQPNTCHHG